MLKVNKIEKFTIALENYINNYWFPNIHIQKSFFDELSKNSFNLESDYRHNWFQAKYKGNRVRFHIMDKDDDPYGYYSEKEWVIDGKKNIDADNFEIIEVCKNKSVLSFEKENGDKGFFDLADKSYYIERKGKSKRQVKDLRRFFTNYRIFNLHAVDNEYNDFLKLIQQCEYRCQNIQSFLNKFEQYTFLEQMMLYPGLKFQMPTFHTCDGHEVIGEWGLRHPLKDYKKEFIDALVKHEITLTPTVERKVFNNNEEDIDTFYKVFFEVFGNEDYKEAFGDLIIDGYEFDYELIRKCNLNIKSYIEYLYYIVLREGLTPSKAVTEHRDYLSMIRKMLQGRKIKNKYPKMLLSVHHITVKNYNRFKEKHNEEMFSYIVNDEDYERLEYGIKDNKSKYEIIRPKVTQDLKNEGVSLNHCVGSYVDRVSNGKTKILFLRKKKDPESPFVTIEVKDNKLNQVSAAYNHVPDSSVLKFLQQYCKSKKIINERYNNV